MKLKCPSCGSSEVSDEIATMTNPYDFTAITKRRMFCKKCNLAGPASIDMTKAMKEWIDSDKEIVTSPAPYPSSKITQIVSMFFPAGPNNGECNKLIALCEDGSIWEQWHSMGTANIPTDRLWHRQEAAADKPSEPTITPYEKTNAGHKPTCPICGSKELECNGPRTKYACGSSDYDQRPGTFTKGADCKDPFDR